MKIKILILSALTFAGVAIVSCSENVLETLTEPNSQPAYTMTVEATKGNNGTRALADAGETLTATWTAGDKVSVWNEGLTFKYGELTAQTSGATTTLIGTLDRKPGNGQELFLEYLSANYSSQDGTLTGRPTSIDKVCDYATAKLYAKVDGESVTGTASFSNEQAIVKFRLLNKANSAALNVTKLRVNVGGTIYTVTPPAATNELYVALPGMINKEVALIAQVGSVYYDCFSPASQSTSFVNGSFHHVTAKLTEVKPMAQADATSIGRVIGLDGNMYVHVASAVTAGTSACAIVAYAGSETGETQNHGLAISMKNAEGIGEGGSGGNYWAIKDWSKYLTEYDNVHHYATPEAAIAAKESGSANCEGKADDTKFPAFYRTMNNIITVSDGITNSAPASGTSGWFLPSLYQWNSIVKGLTGKTADLTGSRNDDYKAEKLNAKIIPAGGDGFEAYGYWSSTEQENKNETITAWSLYLFEGDNKQGSAIDAGKMGANRTRAVFAF